MPAFQFYNPAPVFFDLLGLEPAAGGTLQFYDLGTTTPRPTWSDPDLTILNSNPVVLDGAGRANTAIFMDGSYTVAMFDAQANQLWTRDVIPGGDAGQTIPALDTGEFLTNDGVNLLWQPVRQMPDPTGSTNQYLVTNGAGYTLTNVPEPPGPPPDPEIVVGAASFQAGISSDPTKFLLLRGTGTAPATGGQSSSSSISFDTPFDAIWHVSVTPNVSVVNTIGATVAVTGYSPGSASTGVTAEFTNADDGGESGWQIINPIPYTWVAYGTIEVPAP